VDIIGILHGLNEGDFGSTQKQLQNDNPIADIAISLVFLSKSSS